MWATRKGLGAAALIVGGLVWATVWFFHALAGDDGAVLGLGQEGWRTALFPALAVLPFGAWVFYVRLGSRAAGLGLAGAAAVELGLLAMLVGNALDLWVVDDGWAVFLMGAFTTLGGVLALGLAVTRSGVLPRETGMAFAGGLAAFVAGALAIPVFGVGWLLWGYVLLAGTRDDRA